MSVSLLEHGACLTIDLGAIVVNWRSLVARAAPAKAAAVVKADAYGCGIERVVPALAKAGCDTFFVAHLSEAWRARAVAPEATIYVLNGLLPGSARLYVRDRLRPVLGSLPEIAEWLTVSPLGERPAALHVDTGMNRLGLAPSDLAAMPSSFRPALVMSHLVSAEVPDDPINARQIEAFADIASRCPGIPTSLCNSSGLFLDADARHDLVRPGYALYGGNPTPGEANPMRPVIALEAPIIQLRHVARGDTVGYNAQWAAPRESVIATVSLGYADGYLRAGTATNATMGGEALVSGTRCPIVGRVSMDLITLDVTDVPRVARGDPATFIGGALDIDTVAGFLKTNGYEVLTSLGARYARHYIGG